MCFTHMHVNCITNLLHAFVWKDSRGASGAVLCLDNEMRVTMCNQTDHLYVCMLLTVRQAIEAKSAARKVALKQQKT